jgi:hypothetical protein
MLHDQEPEPDYKVGFKRPPKHAWFKPGESGNPTGKGKERKTPNFANTLEDLLAEVVQVSIDGKPVTMTTKEWMVERLGMKAAKGSVGALNSLLDLYDTEDPRELEPVVIEIPEEVARVR